VRFTVSITVIWYATPCYLVVSYKRRGKTTLLLSSGQKCKPCAPIRSPCYRSAVSLTIYTVKIAVSLWRKCTPVSPGTLLSVCQFTWNRVSDSIVYADISWKRVLWWISYRLFPE